MAAEKAPAYQWYPKDAETDEAYRLMTCEQLGVYERLRDHQWLEGSLPDDVGHLAVIVGHGMSATRLRKIWPEVSACFPTVGNGRLQNGRLERQRREQSDFHEDKRAAGIASAEARRLKHGTSQPNSVRTASEQPVRTPPEPPSASASASAKEHERARVRMPMNGTLDDALAERAGQFCERYAELYQQHRRGARYLPKPALDYTKAVELCQVWDNERLERLAVVFLKCEEPFAESGSRTIGQFAAMASWADGRLREVEAQA